MKKLLLLLLVLPAIGMAQTVCSPDPGPTVPGIYPDSATGIPEAQEGVYYDTTLTAVVPVDTTVMFMGNPITATIDSIVLVEIAGFPGWLTLSCDPAGCSFPGGTRGCGRVTGTPPAGAAGSYPLDIITAAYGNFSGFPLPVQRDTAFNYYTLVVQPGTGIEIKKEIPTSIYPNPGIGNRLFIRSTSPIQRVSIYDMTGKMISNQTGGDHMEVNVSSWLAGLYIIKVETTSGIYWEKWEKAD